MPTLRFFGLAKGVEFDARPTIAATSTGLPIEVALTIDDGAGNVLTRIDVVNALEAIQGELVICPWPPAVS